MMDAVSRPAKPWATALLSRNEMHGRICTHTGNCQVLTQNRGEALRLTWAGAPRGFGRYTWENLAKEETLRQVPAGGG